jgi:hypothetical protein
MSDQKPIRTFIAKDNDGNNYDVNVFPGIISLEGESISNVTYKDEVFYTSDGIQLFPTDEGTYVSKEESLELTIIA